MEYLQPFLIGGSVISGAKLVSTYFNPLYASIIGGLPTGIIASLFLPIGENKKYYESYAYTSVLLALAINIIHQLNQSTTLDPRVVSLAGLIIWGLLSFFLVRDYLVT